MSKFEQDLCARGIQIPGAAKPVAAYVPGVRSGNLIFISGQLPFVNGELQYRGKLGADISVEDAYEAAKICALNCLGVVKSMVGDLDQVEKIVRVGGFVNCTGDFEAHPKVVNGASDLLYDIFGEIGSHSRSAVGAASLPMGTSCEVEMVVQVKA